jgi:hypothetical protein
VRRKKGSKVQMSEGSGGKEVIVEQKREEKLLNQIFSTFRFLK